MHTSQWCPQWVADPENLEGRGKKHATTGLTNCWRFCIDTSWLTKVKNNKCCLYFWVGHGFACLYIQRRTQRTSTPRCIWPVVRYLFFKTQIIKFFRFDKSILHKSNWSNAHLPMVFHQLSMVFMADFGTICNFQKLYSFWKHIFHIYICVFIVMRIMLSHLTQRRSPGWPV